MHQLPASPSNLRVRTWRRLQQLGAVPVKQAVYVLPDTPTAREDFEWLKTEIKGAGGDASVFAADNIDTWSDDALVDEFRRARQEAYAALAAEIEGVLSTRDASRRPRGTRAPAVGRLLAVFRERLAALEHVDFFGSAGRDRVATLLAQLEDRTPATPRAGVRARPAPAADLAAYAGRLWVTRPRPGVDRMASAWLIRRFIDAEARFGFAWTAIAAGAGRVPFDMFGVEFSHQGDGCTFETLCAVFGIADPAVERIAAIVHDLDLKDGRFGAPDAPTVGTLIEGLQLATADDDALLERGIALFESFYRAFAQSARASGPRTVATRRARSTASRSRTSTRRRGGRAKREPLRSRLPVSHIDQTAGTRAALLRLCAAGFAAYGSYAMCRSPLLPLFARELGAGPSTIGVVVGASRLRHLPEDAGWRVVRPAWPSTASRGRRARVRVDAVLVSGRGVALALVGLRLMHGSATALFGPVASASVSDLAPAAQRGAWMSIYADRAGDGTGAGSRPRRVLHCRRTLGSGIIAAGLVGVGPAYRDTVASVTAAVDARGTLGGVHSCLAEVVRHRLVLITSLAQAANSSSTAP